MFEANVLADDWRFEELRLWVVFINELDDLGLLFELLSGRIQYTGRVQIVTFYYDVEEVAHVVRVDVHAVGFVVEQSDDERQRKVAYLLVLMRLG